MKENNNFINSKKKSWIKPIYTMFVVAIPALLLWLFFSNDVFGQIIKLKYWHKILISIAFLLFSVSLTSLLIYLKILEISILSFVVPTSVCFMAIFLTDALEPWARALIVIPFVFLVIPLNIFCKKLEIKVLMHQKLKDKLNKQKIVGSK